MTIVFKAPLAILIVAAAVFVVVVLAALLRKDVLWRKLLSVGFAFLLCGGLILWRYHDTKLVVDGQGIHADTYGKVNIAWSDVAKAQLIANIAASPYGPTNKAWGLGIGSSKMGWFRLRNGSTAFVTVENPEEALMIQTGSTTYVFGPNDFQAFVDAVAAHVTVTK